MLIDSEKSVASSLNVIYMLSCRTVEMVDGVSNVQAEKELRSQNKNVARKQTPSSFNLTKQTKPPLSTKPPSTHRHHAAAVAAAAAQTASSSATQTECSKSSTPS